MEKTYDKIIAKFENELEIIESENENILIIADQSINRIKATIKQLQKLIVAKKIKTQIDEIEFFKQIKPKIYAKLIYYINLLNIESKLPQGSPKVQKKYLKGEIRKIQNYINDNLEFYQYFKRGETYLDHHYFSRHKEDIRKHPDNLQFFFDENFSTSHDSTLAKIIAYEMLIVYLYKKIEQAKIENDYKKSNRANEISSNLNWTGSKVDLVELIYALHTSGVINNGTADIKELASACERGLNIDLGDYYRTFLEIRSRKMNNTKFIDFLKVTLVKRIEESDK